VKGIAKEIGSSLWKKRRPCCGKALRYDLSDDEWGGGRGEGGIEEGKGNGKGRRGMEEREEEVGRGKWEVGKGKLWGNGSRGRRGEWWGFPHPETVQTMDASLICQTGEIRRLVMPLEVAAHLLLVL